MILGIDFSLTATGVCAITDGDAECIKITSKKEEHWHEFPARVANIALEIEKWVGDQDPTVILESPAFAAKSSSLDRMFGGWWLLVDILATAIGYDAPLLVTPTQLKRFAVGKGNAGKEEVMAAMIRRYPDVNITDNNTADATALAAIGAAAYGEPFNRELTKAQQEVVEAVRHGREK